MLSFQSFLVHQRHLFGLKVVTGRQELVGVEKGNELAESQQDNTKHPQAVVLLQSKINQDIMSHMTAQKRKKRFKLSLLLKSDE